MTLDLLHRAPSPAFGGVADGFESVAETFAAQLARGDEVGASLCVHHRGRLVVDLWGGNANQRTGRPWERDTRVVLFSVTKGFTAMAFHLLADRGALDWHAPVADYWPGFAQNGKNGITVATLLEHKAGLLYLDEPLTLEDCTSRGGEAKVLHALEAQRPAWAPGTRQGYHAITFGMYARELFERVAEEPLGQFLRRELFEPLESDVYLGTPASEDAKVATLYAPPASGRLGKMAAKTVLAPRSAEANIARDVLKRDSMARRAFLNPATGPEGVIAYNRPPARRASLAWASATGSALGVSRAYLPFASGGEHDGKRYLRAQSLAGAQTRQNWSSCDEVLKKPLGWSRGFLKEERHIFCPNPASFGHAGMGGSLGWCDPGQQVAFGYVMNRMDWHVRSPRAVALCRALYECEPLLGEAAAPSAARANGAGAHDEALA